MALVYTILGTNLYSLHVGEAIDTLYSYFAPNVLLMAIAVFVFVTYFFKAIAVPKKLTKVIVMISNLCFGVYLIHVFVLDFFTRIGFEVSIFHSVFSVPIITISTFAVSLGLIFLLSKIPIANKYLM